MEIGRKYNNSKVSAEKLEVSAKLKQQRKEQEQLQKKVEKRAKTESND